MDAQAVSQTTLNTLYAPFICQSLLLLCLAQTPCCDSVNDSDNMHNDQFNVTIGTGNTQCQPVRAVEAAAASLGAARTQQERVHKDDNITNDAALI